MEIAHTGPEPYASKNEIEAMCSCKNELACTILREP